MKKFELVIGGGCPTAARAVTSSVRVTAGARDELDALPNDLTAERTPIDTVERNLVGGRFR